MQTSKHGETRRVTQPTKQCRRKRVSEQESRVHDKYGETRHLAFFKLRRHDAGGCWQGLWTSFQCHLVQVHLTARGHSKSNFKSQCKDRTPRQPTVMQRNSDDKLEFSLKQNRSKNVTQKRRDKHGESRCRGKNWWPALKDSNTTNKRVLKCGEQVYTRF